MSILQVILGSIFLIAGLIVFILEVYGVYNMKFVLNRMHAAATGDTLGLFFSLIGLMILSGFNFITLKIGLVILFFWLSSPVSSHILSKLVFRTEKKLDKKVTYYGELSELEKKLEKERESANE